MAFTLNDLLIGAYRRVGALKVSTLTTTSSGTQTTFQDATLPDDTSDDDFNDGTLFIMTATASTTSEGHFSRITDYAASSGKFTVDPGIPFSSVASSGQTYGYTSPEFGMALMVELANDALRSIGPLVFIDKNTLVSSAATLEYQQELAWKREEPFQIDLQTDVSSTALRNAWVTVRGWHYEPASAGSTSGRIIFDSYLPVGRKVRVWYKGDHARITADTDSVDERIHPDLAIAILVERMYEYRNSLNRGSLPFDVQRWNDAKMQAAQMRVQYQIWQPKKKSKLLLVGGDGGDHLPYPYPYGPGP